MSGKEYNQQFLDLFLHYLIRLRFRIMSIIQKSCYEHSITEIG